MILKTTCWLKDTLDSRILNYNSVSISWCRVEGNRSSKKGNVYSSFRNAIHKRFFSRNNLHLGVHSVSLFEDVLVNCIVYQRHTLHKHHDTFMLLHEQLITTVSPWNKTEYFLLFLLLLNHRHSCQGHCNTSNITSQTSQSRHKLNKLSLIPRKKIKILLSL